MGDHGRGEWLLRRGGITCCRARTRCDSTLCLTHVCPAAVAQAERAYYKLRLERTNAKHVGMRAKRLAETEAEEKAKTK